MAALFVVEIARRVGTRLAERVAVWLLPESQPATFRAAFLIAALAARLAPPIVVCEPWEPPDNADGSARLSYRLRRTHWPDAIAAIAELEADLQSSRHVTRPISFVLPVLRGAAELRFAALSTHLVRSKVVEIKSTDRTLTMRATREFLSGVPCVMTISPADVQGSEELLRTH